MGTDQAKTSAQAVSRALRKAGYHTTPDFNHWGMRVRHANNAGEVSVSAYFESDTQCLRMATDAAETLRSLGYDVRQNEHHVYVKKP